MMSEPVPLRLMILQSYPDPRSAPRNPVPVGGSTHRPVGQRFKSLVTGLASADFKKIDLSIWVWPREGSKLDTPIIGWLILKMD